MSSYDPIPIKSCRINSSSKEEFIKWLRKHINEQITSRLIQHAEEEL